MNEDLLLVRLPKISTVDQEFYGLGYYSDSGFIFVLITEDFINVKPLKNFPFPKDIDFEKENYFEIIGTIKNIKSKKTNE